jgi:aspartyl-tRNA(Asn)/glutamyl-tRNA(Gln) amidotransferase subunit A
MNLTLSSYLAWVKEKKFSPQEVISHYLQKAKMVNEKYFAFLRFHDEYISKHKEDFSWKPLMGAPIALKDNIMTEGEISSNASKITEDYRAPYSASFFQDLENAGAMMMGKTNMDEFAMGSSTETSAFGNTINPHGTWRVPGGSSWWSAVAVAADLCLAAIWSDTAGSVRQPAALCGVVGFKPSYGRISRYGIMPMANSFDQVWLFTKTVEDCALLFSYLAKQDVKDAQSKISEDFVAWKIELETDITKIRFALPKEFISEWLHPWIKKSLLEIVEKLRKAGATVDEVSLPTLDLVLPIYYTLMPAELSTNLARFDGIKFWLQNEMSKYPSLLEYYQAVRSKWFGDEAKRRIFIGTYVLSSENYELYYLQAKKAQMQMKKEFENLFQNYDIVFWSTSPDLAWKFGAKIDDPIKMYLSDAYTVPANICWLPGLSLPAGFVEDQGENLPRGLNLMSKFWDDKKLLQISSAIEQLITL